MNTGIDINQRHRDMSAKQFVRVGNRSTDYRVRHFSTNQITFNTGCVLFQNLTNLDRSSPVTKNP